MSKGVLTLALVTAFVLGAVAGGNVDTLEGFGVTVRFRPTYADGAKAGWEQYRRAAEYRADVTGEGR